MPASRAPGTSASLNASSALASPALSTLSGTPWARACSGVSMTSTPPTVNASAPAAAPCMNVRRLTGSIVPPLNFLRVSRLLPCAGSSRRIRQGYTRANGVVTNNSNVKTEMQLLLHDHLGADRHAVVEIDDLFVHQPEAARRYRMSDRLGRVGAVNAIDRLAEIERAGAERIAGTAGHPARQIRLPFDHLGRRRPVRPFRLARDPQQPVPAEAVAPDADAVAHRSVVALDQIEKALRGIDDDRARHLVAAVEHGLVEVRWIDRGFRLRARHDARFYILDVRHDVTQLEGRAVLRLRHHCGQRDRRQSHD